MLEAQAPPGCKLPSRSKPLTTSGWTGYPKSMRTVSFHGCRRSGRTTASWGRSPGQRFARTGLEGGRPAPFPSPFPVSSLGSGVPQATRRIELLVKPLTSGSWDRAITALCNLQAVVSVNLGASFTTDSWDSSNTAKYPNGLYDADDVSPMPSWPPTPMECKWRLAVLVYGNVRSNGGTPKHTQNVTGIIDTNFSSSGIQYQQAAVGK